MGKKKKHKKSLVQIVIKLMFASAAIITSIAELIKALK
jgi:hypothetical protein